MIIVLCPRCSITLRVIGDSDEVHALIGERSDFWPDKYPCPRCTTLATACLEIDVEPSELERLGVRDLTAQEAFAAFNGLGLPEEQVCNKTLLENLLRERPVRSIGARDIDGSRRCYLHHIELWDGTRIYFGSGSGGAVVYRIAPPYSYTEQVTRELDAD